MVRAHTHTLVCCCGLQCCLILQGLQCSASVQDVCFVTITIQQGACDVRVHLQRADLLWSAHKKQAQEDLQLCFNLHKQKEREKYM